MHAESTRQRPASGQDRAHLSLALAVLVREAQRVTEGSAAWLTLAEAARPLHEALYTEAPISLERAHGLAEASVVAGWASWGEDEAFTPGVALRARLRALGVSRLAELRADEADGVEAFLAASARTTAEPVAAA